MDPPSLGLLYFPVKNEGELDTPGPGSKRRRLRGACDACRQRKVRCDSARLPGKVCSNCIAFNCQCTHGHSKVESLKKSPSTVASESAAGQPSQEFNSYNGKTASEHVDTILIQSTAYIAAQDLREILLDIARYSRNLEQELENVKLQLSDSRSCSVSASPPDDAKSTIDDSVVDSSPDGIMVLFQDMTISTTLEPFFYGRSSSFFLIQTAQALKAEHHGINVPRPKPIRRKEFWNSEWEITPSPLAPVYNFPPEDLLEHLVSIYFSRINILTGGLHRPTFDRSLTSNLHLLSSSFGAVVLAVCALASRYSDDPRVIFEGTDSKLSSGWEWFRQIRDLDDVKFRLALNLYDVQRIFLSVLYLQGTSSPTACWTLTAIGIKHLQDHGLHMRKQYRGYHDSTSVPTAIEEELYTRAFWLLICCDTLMSAFLGKPRITRDEDYDVDYPLEVDDAYWEHSDSEQAFQQPQGKPSVYSFIVSYLKLTEILGAAQKTIYSVKRSRRSPGWSQTAVAGLDSALNQWLDSIPDHLRWDPNREEEPFATQSACLYASYYHVQIQIHRSFIPSPMNDAPLSSTFPSLAICANSARSCSRVMEVQARRSLVAHPQVVSALMDSAIVILLNVWGAGRTGISVDPQRAMQDVQKCIHVLKMYETHWQAAGRYCDLLFTVGNQLINNPPTPSTTLKRGRESEDARSSFSAAMPVASQAGPQDFRAFSGSSRVSASIREHAMDSTRDQHIYPLPISTEELGHLPVYQSFDWGMSFETHTNPNLSDTGISLDFGGSGDPAQYMFAGYDSGDRF
ncbi:fungal-specific transcription factor domain-containing protein [Mycena sanguinolenta]|nr:fungal-specific transcription factor domain-containing protein [Mycena sanguinolenta]